MNPEDPKSREEIVAAFDDLSHQGLAFWSEFTPGQFATPIGDAWSPADNVRHLIKSTQPVAKALKLPGLALRSLFGQAKKDSMSYSDLVATYKAALAAGGNAGKYAPEPADVPNEIESWQRSLISECRDSISDLRQAAVRWSEGDLDRFRLPHPLLGKLTLREMLLFTLYHYNHHKENVVRRLRESELESKPADM